MVGKININYTEEFQKKEKTVRAIHQVYKDTGKMAKKLKHAHQRLIEHQKNFIKHLETCASVYDDEKETPEIAQIKNLYHTYSRTMVLLNEQSSQIVDQLRTLYKESEHLNKESKKVDRLKDAYANAEKMQMLEYRSYDRTKTKEAKKEDEDDKKDSKTKRPTKVPTSSTGPQPNIKVSSPKNKLLKKEFSWKDTKAYADDLYRDTINELNYQEIIFRTQYTKTMDDFFESIRDYCTLGIESFEHSQMEKDALYEKVKAPKRKAVERSKFKALHKKKVKSLDVSDPNSIEMQRVLFGKRRNGTLTDKRSSYSISTMRNNSSKSRAHTNDTSLNTNGNLSTSLSAFVDKKLFAEPLIDVMSRDHEHGLIPQFYEQALYYIEHHGLHTVGIFRVPGSVSIMQSMIDRANQFQPLVSCEDEGYSLNDVAGLIKKYLRQLPDPPITHQFYDAAIAIVNPQSGLSKDEQISYLKKLLTRLPSCHLYIMQRTLVMLHRIARHSEVNKMDAKNLSLVFGLNFLRPKNNNPLIAASITPYCNDFVNLLLENLEVVLDVNDYHKHFASPSLDYEALLYDYHVYPESSTTTEFFHIVNIRAELESPKIASNNSTPTKPLDIPQASTFTLSCTPTSNRDTLSSISDENVSPSYQRRYHARPSPISNTPDLDLSSMNPSMVSPTNPSMMSPTEMKKKRASTKFRRSLSQTPSSNSTDFFANLVRQNMARQEIDEKLVDETSPSSVHERPASLVL